MTENLKKAFEAASSNEELGKALIALAEKNFQKEEMAEEIVSLMKGYGITLTKEELLEADKECTGSKEMSDDELESVGGGRVVYKENKSFYYSITYVHSDCWCAAGGGGVEDADQHTCACVLGGAGKYKDRLARNLGEAVCMVCALAGMSVEKKLSW